MQHGSTPNPLAALADYGQAVWLDYIHRNLLVSGDLQRLVDEDGVRGLTSNPAIFEKAVTSGTAYHDILNASDAHLADSQTLYERIVLRDIRDAADVLRPVYDSSQGRDGYVSLEVSPGLARNGSGTLDEARRLWRAVDRPNLMIKAPGTPQAVDAVRRLITEGVNVNVTLLFSQSAYEQFAESYMAGLETRGREGGDLSRVASVASFFVSRIDSAVDKLLSQRVKNSGSSAEQAQLRGLMGKVAVANAKQTYQRYLRLFSGPRWDALAARGARTQRVLWASTGTKNPAYSDVLYVEELIGRDTVNTLPLGTLEAFRDHGRPRESLTEGLTEANATMETLARLRISMQDVTGQLLDEGIELFAAAFDGLLKAVGGSHTLAAAQR